MTNGMTNWTKVAKLDDIPREGARIVRTKDGCIALFRTADDEIFALDDRCPHKGGPLSDGIVHAHSVTCPLHNAVISLENGAVTSDDFPAVKTYQIRVEDGQIYLALHRLEKVG